MNSYLWKIAHYEYDGFGEAGFGFGMGGSGSGSGNDGTESGNLQATVYERIYEWDERDRLTGSTEGNTVVGYVYGEDGNRTNKFSSIGETLYFNNLWTWHDAKSLGSGGQTTKNIYLGTERIVSKLNRGEGLDTYSEEYHKTYYWHTDHLGSAHFITDYHGNEYQRIEYTPYGEEWVELKSDTGDQYLPYKFTGKERDEETGLYYYGARYLDPVYSRWISTDPAVGEYLPLAPTNDDACKRNQNLPGMGGVFNTVNMQLYHYAGNNPLLYKDPNGRIDFIYTLDENGNISITEENKWVIFEFLHGDKYFVETFDGKRYRANSKETVELYEWNQIDVDFMENDFTNLLKEKKSIKTDFSRVLNESVGGDLDFKLDLKKNNPSTLYLMDGIVYNRNEAGNFIWAYFLQDNGFGSFISGGLAQAGSLINGRFDEPWDTAARHAGLKYYKETHKK